MVTWETAQNDHGRQGSNSSAMGSRQGRAEHVHLKKHTLYPTSLKQAGQRGLCGSEGAAGVGPTELAIKWHYQ